LLTLKAWAAIGEAARDEGRGNDALMLRVYTTDYKLVGLALPVAAGRISYRQIHVFSFSDWRQFHFQIKSLSVLAVFN
jgi:hypothetical protein